MITITESNQFKELRRRDKHWYLIHYYNALFIQQDFIKKKINHRLPWSLWCSCPLLKMTLPLKSNFFYMVILEVNQSPPKAAKIHYSIYNLAFIVTPVPKPTFTNIHKLQQYQITLCLGLALKEKQTKTIKKALLFSVSPSAIFKNN